MLDNQPDPNQRSTMQVVLGFLLGVVSSLGCLFFSIFLASALGLRQHWMYPVLDAAGMILVGIVALRHVRESRYARGMVIALSLALVLDAAWGVAFLK